MNRWTIGALVFATAAAAGACGGGGGGDEAPGAFVIANYADEWMGVTGAADGMSVDILVSGADPSLPTHDPCYEEYSTVVDEAADAVTVTVNVGRATGTDCTLDVRRVTVDLDAPAGTRAIANAVSLTRYVPGPGGGYYNEAVVNEAGPAEACAPEAYAAAVAREIVGGTAAGNERCEAQFLVLDVTITPDEAVNRAYFVNHNGPWRVVTYGADLTCDAVFEQSGVQFPPGVC